MGMTKQQYDDYVQTVKDFFEKEGINCLTTRPADEDDDCEPSFSWSDCECCGTTLGGDRYDASGYNPKADEVFEYSVCQDCLYFAEYGQLDDMTMMDMEDGDE